MSLADNLMYRNRKRQSRNKADYGSDEPSSGLHAWKPHASDRDDPQYTKLGAYISVLDYYETIKANGRQGRHPKIPIRLQALNAVRRRWSEQVQNKNCDCNV